MSCLAVRERLPEHALGVLPQAERPSVDRHLEWCAACRKEASELQRAAATLSYTVAPAEPPAELEERVVEAVRSAAGRRRASAPRRSRIAAAGVLAAMLALSGLGWGAVMAGRAQLAEERAADALEKQHDAIERLSEVFVIPEADPSAIVETSTLLSPRLEPGRGDALVLLSPSGGDLVFVLVNDLRAVTTRQLPLTVRLVGGSAGPLTVGKVRKLDPNGASGVFANFDEDLTDVSTVVIRDALGRILLRGTLSVYEPTA